MRAVQGCRRFLNDLGDYLDGALTATERLAFEHHAQECSSCQILQNTVEKTIHYFKAWDTSPIPVDVDARLWKALESRMRSASAGSHA